MKLKPFHRNRDFGSAEAKLPRLRKAAIASLIGVALAVSAASVANAAQYTYANNVSASEQQVFDSGSQASIVGGTAVVEAFSADGGGVVVYLETYRPAPGYQTIAFSSGGGETSLSHQAAANARQQCYWDYPYGSGDIGTLKITCSSF